MPVDGFQPEQRRPYFLLRVWTVWAAIALLSYARHYIECTHPFGWTNGSWQDLVSWFACFCPWAILTPAIFRIEERYPLVPGRWRTRLAGLLAASFAFTCIALLIDHTLYLLIDAAFGKLQTSDLAFWHVRHSVSLFRRLGLWSTWSGAWFWHVRRGDLLFGQFGFWSTWAAAWALRTFAQYHRQARRATYLALEKSQLEASLQRAELENLRMRLNPHFLFNTLQNISVLTQQNPKLATQMLTRLGDLLRVALRRDVCADTTLQEELTLTKDYLAVEKMRLGDRLTILEDVETETKQALIPSFLLQPLVENAVIHGLRGAAQTGTIVMQARRESEQLILKVADNGRGLPENWQSDLKVGVGLSSTQERLARMYPGTHDFQIRRLEEGGTEVRIVIPYRVNEEVEEKALHEQASPVSG